uniref:5-carboxymethyl-2-hydroxymuconate isomerase n=1 Tax=OCS116 cluster bacterium TaxID=2030921 RepID=A0A2A4YS12_9PROT
MPHFIIEFSKDLDKELDMKKILQICLDAAADSQLLDMKTVEARAFEVAYGLNVSGEASFLHVKITLFPGRDEAQLATLSKNMYKRIATFVEQSAAQVANISTQVREIDPKFCFHN